MHSGHAFAARCGFEVDGELKPADACRCSQCRRQSGHYWSSTNVPGTTLRLRGEDKLSWLSILGKSTARSCSICGSALFWGAAGHDFIAIGIDAFDKPTGTRLEKHIFVVDKGDHDDTTDDLPQNERY